jgi:pSer/pThr/pTyr-binding forkhead associated (FHA) protein
VLYFVQTQQSVIVDKDEFRIGKNAGMSDYVITNNSSVSRQHAVIQRRNGQFFVTDLGSTNGTFVNEKRISGTVQLQDGDNIRYADVISVFNIVR